MNSILAIDLGYFNQLPEPDKKLECLLRWAEWSVSMIVLMDDLCQEKCREEILFGVFLIGSFTKLS
jgi:hypothetical protein